jgi:hypothetical protein
MFDEEQHKNIRKILKSLPKVKAKEDFESNLYRRIREVESEKYSAHSLRKYSGVHIRKLNWFTNIFKPAYVSAIGVTVILLICIFVYFSYLPHKTEESNPVVPGTSIQNEQQKQQIAKQENITGEKEMKKNGEKSLENKEYIPVFPESEKTPTDFGLPTESPKMDKLESPVPPERSIEAEPRTIEQEVKGMEKSEDTKKIEKKEAPIMRKGEESKTAKDVIPKISNPPLMYDKIIESDTINPDSNKIRTKKDSAKVKGIRDSLKTPVKDEEQPIR